MRTVLAKYIKNGEWKTHTGEKRNFKIITSPGCEFFILLDDNEEIVKVVAAYSSGETLGSYCEGEDSNLG